MANSNLTAEQLELVKRMVNGIEIYALEEDSKIFVLDHIDSLEEALRQENMNYTEEQKEEMVSQIQKGLDEAYGEENVYYGSSELHVPVDGQIKTYHAQLAIHLVNNE
ncbi:hypothetical protein ACWA2C_28255 [Priestia megaterium]